MLAILADNLPILLLSLAGLALLVIEVFLPGFGVCGLSGLVISLAAVVVMWANHGIVAALLLVLVMLGLLAVALSISLKSAAKGRLSASKLVLHDAETDEMGYRSTEDRQVFLGREGKTLTALRPIGSADFDGVRLNVMSDGAFIPAGSKVQIVRVDGAKLLVKVVA